MLCPVVAFLCMFLDGLFWSKVLRILFLKCSSSSSSSSSSSDRSSDRISDRSSDSIDNI